MANPRFDTGNYRIVPSWRQAHSVVRSAGSWWPGSTVSRCPWNCGRSPASSVLAASSSSRATSTSPGRSPSCAYEAARLVPDLPLWVSVDQEGGRVARLKAPFTEWPPMAALGRSGDVRLAERFARALAAELRAVGVTLDYTPVLDVHTNSRNPVIGDRALSGKAEEVARFGAAIIRTLQAEGIAACGKHFPGHGDTSTDSHLELPLVEHPPDRLRQVEFVPFRAAIEAGVATIMTAHVLVPSLDEKRPATLSRRIVSGLLREELGYDGVILSDDLEMKAIANEYTVPSAAVLAIEAGCDGVLICSGDHDHAGGGARIAGARRGGRAGCRTGASRTR